MLYKSFTSISVYCECRNSNKSDPKMERFRNALLYQGHVRRFPVCEHNFIVNSIHSFVIIKVTGTEKSGCIAGILIIDISRYACHSFRRAYRLTQIGRSIEGVQKSWKRQWNIDTTNLSSYIRLIYSSERTISVWAYYISGLLIEPFH